MFVPPASLITGRVIFCVMNGTKRNSELIAHFDTKSLRLSKANVMRLRGSAPTNEAGLLGDKAQMWL